MDIRQKPCLPQSEIAPHQSGQARKKDEIGKAMPNGRQIMPLDMLVTGICKEMSVILNCGKKLNRERIFSTQEQMQGCGRAYGLPKILVATSLR